MKTRLPQVTVLETGPNSFAVIGADGAVIRDYFKRAAAAWMWAAKRGLHTGRDKKKREAVAIPSELEGERVLGLPLLAKMSNRSYGEFLALAKSGAFGPLLKINERAYGLRLSDWRASMAAREIKTTA